VIEAWDEVARECPEAASEGLRDRLHELLGGGAVRLESVSSLKPKKVLRLCFRGASGTQSLVVKRLACEIADRNRRVCERWLPAVGLDGTGLHILATVGGVRPDFVWQVYEDFGDWAIRDLATDRDRVAAAVTGIVELHARFREHPMLAECRMWGGDLGMQFFRCNVRDALRAVAALRPLPATAEPERKELCHRLTTRLEALVASIGIREAICAEHAGPETLLHGDLWRRNVFVVPMADRLQVRLIDWDHAAVGQVHYDLSTLLSRFQPVERPAVLDLYRTSAARLGLHVPPDHAMAVLFETAELARLANRLIWPALAVVDGSAADWGFDTLAEVERWFLAWRPIMPDIHLPRERRAS
jgi:hypothetical protein